MNCNDIKPGMKVKVTRDDGTEGMFVLPDNIRTRGVGKIGAVINYVPGHGGDVWFVRHDDGVAAYCFTEIEPETGDSEYIKLIRESFADIVSLHANLIAAQRDAPDGEARNLHFRHVDLISDIKGSLERILLSHEPI